jgi:putative aldouronate transport system substrate-binding protein
MNRALSAAAASALALFLAAGAAGLLASCGEEKPPAKIEYLTVAYPAITEAPEDLPSVEAEINARFSARIGSNVRLVPIPRRVFERQLSMMLASASPPDLFATDAGELHTRISRGQALALDNLLVFGGRNIARAIAPEYLRVGRSQGQTFAVPSIRDYASYYGVLMREDLIDKHNIQLEGIRHLADLEPVLRRIKEAEPDMVPLGLSDFRAFLYAYNNEYDQLGDDEGVLADLSPNAKVTNLFETRWYEEAAALARKWYLLGYLPRDVDTSRESAEDLLAAGKVFAALFPLTPGSAGQESRITGHALRSVPLTRSVSTTDKVGKVIWAISARSTRSVTAMRFLDLLYADAELVNLLDWGIEGRHYVRITQNVITLPDGAEDGRVGYQPNHGWLFGNQFLSYIFLGDDPNLWLKMGEFNRTAMKSPALGFSFDPAPIKATYIAVRNVMNDYRDGLETGTLDPAAVLPAFRRKLREAGIDAVMAEKQRQLDEWRRLEETRAVRDASGR